MDLCNIRLGRACKDYAQAVLRQDKVRSCYKCKAAKMTAFGVACPSLRLVKPDAKTTKPECRAIGGVNEDGAGVDDEIMEDKCWEKYLL